jgi:hypothetical protein
MTPAIRHIQKFLSLNADMMKHTMKKLMPFILAGSLFIPHTSLMAQEEAGSERRLTEAFTAIEAGGAVNIFLAQDERNSVIVETEIQNIPKVETKVKNGKLMISTKGIRKTEGIKVYVSSPVTEHLDISGAAGVKNQGSLSGGKLMVKASGASNIKLEINYAEVVSDVSGAATLQLSGEASTHHTNVSGAGSLRAAGLQTVTTHATASGAGSATVNATGEVISSTSGAGTVKLAVKPERLTIVSGDVLGEKENVRVYSTDYGDTTKVKVAGIRIEVVEDDSTTVTIGNRKLTVDEKGNLKWCRVHFRRFNGHWAGVELGMNGYLNPDRNMKFAPEDEYMDLRMEKSLQVNLNLYEQNIALSRNQEWGMLTGIGMSWNNYRFRRPTTLYTDSAYLIGYIDEGINVRKSKLAIAYLQVPLLFEWQSQRLNPRHSFHAGLGVILGVRLWSWQKKYYNEMNKEYTLTQYDPATGTYQDIWERNSPNYNKTHTWDDFLLHPFKLDASLRIGWGSIHLFATYNLLPMFRSDKGPELNQYAAGITLLGW